MSGYYQARGQHIAEDDKQERADVAQKKHRQEWFQSGTSLKDIRSGELGTWMRRPPKGGMTHPPQNPEVKEEVWKYLWDSDIQANQEQLLDTHRDVVANFVRKGGTTDEWSTHSSPAPNGFESTWSDKQSSRTLGRRHYSSPANRGLPTRPEASAAEALVGGRRRSTVRERLWGDAAFGKSSSGAFGGSSRRINSMPFGNSMTQERKQPFGRREFGDQGSSPASPWRSSECRKKVMSASWRECRCIGCQNHGQHHPPRVQAFSSAKDIGLHSRNPEETQMQLAVETLRDKAITFANQLDNADDQYLADLVVYHNKNSRADRSNHSDQDSHGSPKNPLKDLKELRTFYGRSLEGGK